MSPRMKRASGLRGTFRIPMRGYESWVQPAGSGAIACRIPLRGYELADVELVRATGWVPNPHEGL